MKGILMEYAEHTLSGYVLHTFLWDGMQCIPILGMLSVSREITPFWYKIQTFVLTVFIHTATYSSALNLHRCHWRGSTVAAWRLTAYT